MHSYSATAVCFFDFLWSIIGIHVYEEIELFNIGHPDVRVLRLMAARLINEIQVGFAGADSPSKPAEKMRLLTLTITRFLCFRP